MKGLIKEQKLEELLVAKWAEFLDVQKLMSYILATVKDRIHSFAVIEQKRSAKNSNQITISRFQLAPNGFILWVEFIVPIEAGKIALGTSELFLTSSGELLHQHTLGDLYCSPTAN